MQLRQKLIWRILPIFLILLLYQLLLTDAYMKSVRIEEIPFGMSFPEDKSQQKKAALNQRTPAKQSGIHLITKLEQQRSFFHLFHVPYIICFFAAKGKWPFIPPFMEVRVNTAARTFFNHNDSFIRQFCQKWIKVKECFRPIFEKNVTVTDEVVESLATQRCNCAKLVATESPVVYFDKNYIGNVSSETIYNTIEFLESFLPPPTKKSKRKNNRVRGRLDEIEID